MDVDIRNALVLANVGLPVYFVRTRLGVHHEFVRKLGTDDAIQICYLALMRAVELFDPAFGCTLSTYACKSFWTELRNAALEGGMIHVPRYVTDGTHATVRLQHRARKVRRVRPLPAKWKKKANQWVEDELPAPPVEDVVEAADDRSAVRAGLESLLRQLKPQHREVIERRYFAGKTLVEVGAELGITKEATRQNQERAIQRLRAVSAKSS